jgi:hypothetical protein
MASFRRCRCIRPSRSPAGGEGEEPQASGLTSASSIINKRIASTAVVLVAAIGSCAVIVFLQHAHRTSSRDRPVWTKTTWPFAVDQRGECGLFNARRSIAGRRSISRCAQKSASAIVKQE